MATNKNLNENEINHADELNKLDKLLLSGKITNAVEFYNYFKNKSNQTNNTNANNNNNNTNISPVPTPTPSQQNSSTLNSYGPFCTSPIPTSSSSSSLSSYSTVSNQPTNSNKRNKNNKTNTLNDYATLLQSSSPQPHPTHKPRNKKQPSSSSSNLVAYNNNNNRNVPHSSIQHLSTSNLSIPTNLFLNQPKQFLMYSLTNSEIRNPNKAHSNYQQLLNQKQSNILTIAPTTPSSLQTILNSASSTPTNNQQFQIASIASTPTPNPRQQRINKSASSTLISDNSDSIFNQYLIDNTDSKLNGNSSLLDNSNQEQQNVENSLKNSSSTNIDSSLNSQHVSISSIFLNSSLTSYYQKYKLEQKQRSKQYSAPNGPNRTAASYLSDNTNLVNPGDYEKRKEDAINRIIRNERIKQIRIKMHEYELLREYQTCTSTANTLEQGSVLGAYQTNDNNNNSEDLFNTTTTSGDNNDDNDEFDFDSSNKTKAKTHSKLKPNKYFSLNNYGALLNKPVSQDLNDDYELDDNEESSLNDDDYSALNKSIPLSENGPNKLSDYNLPSSSDDTLNKQYKSRLGYYNAAKAHEASFDEYKNENYYEDNEESYESGIEDDGFSMTAPIYSKKQNQQQRLLNNLNRSFGGASNIKPGYELYQIGGGLFNLSSSQSTFQLKVSIISAEVKNIVNVLKQV